MPSPSEDFTFETGSDSFVPGCSLPRDPLQRQFGFELGNAKFVSACSGATNQPPVVSAGPDQSFSFGLASSVSTTLAGSVSDDNFPGTGPLTHNWTQISGPTTATFNDTLSFAPVVTLPVAGTYVFRLTASDGQFTVFDSVSVQVIPGADPGPTCDPLRIGFSWRQYGLGVAVISISQSDVDDPIVSYVWTWGNGDSIAEDTGSQGYFYDVTGTFTVNLQITTQSGVMRSISASVPIVAPYDNTTAPIHPVYSTTPAGGLPFCEEVPTP